MNNNQDMAEQYVSYNLKSTKLYRRSELMQVLKNHGLPSTLPWLRKMEKLGVISAPRLPGASKHGWVHYTGAQIKEIVDNLLSRIEKQEPKKLAVQN